MFQRTAKRAGIAWKRNALRHSFISYRLSQIKNVAQISYEAGNSPVMVHRHYLKVVSESSAQRWFNLAPPAEGKIVAMPTPERASGAAHRAVG